MSRKSTFWSLSIAMLCAIFNSSELSSFTLLKSKSVTVGFVRGFNLFFLEGKHQKEWQGYTYTARLNPCWVMIRVPPPFHIANGFVYEWE
jgi:hypothetical protein